MKFKTTINLERQEIQIDHSSGVILLGSCFTEHIGLALSRFKFDVCLNPFGTIFHPIPIAWLIDQSIEKKRLTTKDLEYNGSLYFHDQFHYRFSNPNAEVALKSMNSVLASFYGHLKRSKFLFVSLGSAIGYSHKKKDRIVANCHKQNPAQFQKSFSLVDSMTTMWEKTLKKLSSFNPNLEIIFTISPVRHMRDGMINSSRSKALLNVFVHSLCERHMALHYFPSYELLMDDLRDYRFYDDDLIHPGSMAIEYIWEAFSKAFFSENTKQLNSEIKKILQSRAHKIQHLESDENKTFVKSQIQLIKNLNELNPEIDLREEMEYFSNLI